MWSWTKITLRTSHTIWFTWDFNGIYNLVFLINAPLLAWLSFLFTIEH